MPVKPPRPVQSAAGKIGSIKSTSVTIAPELLPANLNPHNRLVANTPWQQRIRRAENLVSQYPFATEILSFYIHTATFQEDLYQRLERESREADTPQDPVVFEGLLDALFPSFLSLVEKKAPSNLAQVARDLRHSYHDSWPELFSQSWSNLDAPIDPKEFLALAFLQPCAEFARSRAQFQVDGTPSDCPFCRRKPALGILRPQGDGASRSLLCGFCLAEWAFRRIVCPGCGEENHARLPVYTAEELPHIRVECCDTCRSYLKSIDLSKNGLADPLVDELASIPLNLWAEDHGYSKLYPNLFGM